MSIESDLREHVEWGFDNMEEVIEQCGGTIDGLESHIEWLIDTTKRFLESVGKSSDEIEATINTMRAEVERNKQRFYEFDQTALSGIMHKYEDYSIQRLVFTNPVLDGHDEKLAQVDEVASSMVNQDQTGVALHSDKCDAIEKLMPLVDVDGIKTSADQKRNAGKASAESRKNQFNHLHDEWEDQCGRMIAANRNKPLSVPEMANRIHDYMQDIVSKEDQRSVGTIQNHLYKYLKKKS